MSGHDAVSGGSRSSVEREAWLRAAAGIAQLSLGTWLVVAWLVQGPTPITVGLIVASFAACARQRDSLAVEVTLCRT